MEITQHANELAVQGQVREAFTLLSSAVRNGDPKAALHLAQWRMSGDFIRRDIAEARQLFGCAAKLGLHKAEAPYLALLASGAGNIGRCWGEALDRLRTLRETEPLARVQLELLMQMNIDQNGDPEKLNEAETVSTVPYVRKLPQFLTADECRYIIELALPLLQTSVVVHPVTGDLIQDPIRTSTTIAFPFLSEDPVLHAINRRIAVATGTTYDQGEPLQILNYAIGQEYKPHSDALNHVDNQRVLTMLVYLNTSYEGGETLFTKTGMRIRGKRGEAIVFSNVDAQGRADPAANHAGLPVRSGQKMILSKWIRAQPLDLSGPSGRSF